MIYKTYNGSMLDLLQVIEPNSIDSVVTDPPYELGFMGKSWDATGIAFQPDTWKQCYDALKPGGYLLAFGGSRTFHRIACAIEDAGFEIRDTIMWLYGSGFPKSHDISKAIDKKLGAKRKVVGKKEKQMSGWDMDGGTKLVDRDITLPSSDLAKKYAGYGTALKPAFEPVIMARKPIQTTVAENVMKYGVGGINIDECRVGEAGGVKKINIEPNSGSKNSGFGCNGQLEELNDGRFPANLIHDDGFQIDEETQANRYFYSAKASKKDRDEGLGLAGFEESKTTDGNIRANQETARKFGANSALRKNIHPTVKPVELMQYLVRLVSPKGATILDCFMGSGSTGKAVMFENRERDANYKFIGFDLSEVYCKIAEARMDYALNKYEYDILIEQKEMEKKGQLSLF